MDKITMNEFSSKIQEINELVGDLMLCWDGGVPDDLMYAVYLLGEAVEKVSSILDTIGLDPNDLERS